MAGFLFFITILTSIGGGLVLLVGVATSASAPQQAAVAGIAIACAVIPYSLARACQLMWRDKLEERRHQELLDALRGLRPPEPPVKRLADVAAEGGSNSTRVAQA